MKFSVVIPVHNKLPHLDRSINSVLKQSFQDFELILIDDASSDGSSEKIKEFEDSRISIYTRTQPGPGGYAARNLGIAKAKGEWVAFLDADDEWYPHHLEKMNELASKYPDVHFMSAGWEIGNNSNFIKSAFYKKNSATNLKIDLKFYLNHLIRGENPIWTSVVCLKKQALNNFYFFPSEGNASRGGDSFAWLRYLCNGNIIYWSNHVGGRYYRDTINQVTKTAAGEFSLFNKANYSNLSVDLSNENKKLLRKYFNIKLIQNWKLSFDQKEKSRLFRDNILFKDDLLKASKYYLISLLPVSIIRMFKHQK